MKEVNIKAIDVLPSVHWYCRKCLAFATKLLEHNGLKSIIEKLDKLIQTNKHRQTRLLATNSKIAQSTNATCIASESILKVSPELTAINPSINNAAHGVLPKISSVKSAVGKMASTNASTTAIGCK